MQPSWQASFRPEHLRQACDLWDLVKDPMPVEFRVGESFIFRGRRRQEAHGREVAIRLTHPGHRSRAELLAEITWMGFVSEQRVSVPRVWASQNSQLVEAVESEGQSWFATVMEWVRGEAIRPGHPDWHAKTFERWGTQLGRMQRIALDAGDRFFRFDWEHPKIDVIGASFPQRLPQYAAQAAALLARIRALPKTPVTYGLCHRDLHHGNLLVEGPTIHCFDFDDLCHHFFVADLMVPIYSALLFETEDVESLARDFCMPFFRGFRRASPLPSEALASAPEFLSLRDLELVSVGNLWDVPADFPWYTTPANNLEHGNPLAALPWRTWFEEA